MSTEGIKNAKGMIAKLPVPKPKTMSMYERRSFEFASEIAEWLNEKQPKAWQVVSRGVGSLTNEFEVIAEFEEEEDKDV